jgi:hypothetical protein
MIQLRVVEGPPPNAQAEDEEARTWYWLEVVDNDSADAVFLAAIHRDVVPNALGWMEQLKEWMTSFLPGLLNAWDMSGTQLLSMSSMLITDYNSQDDRSLATLHIEGLA